MAVTVDGTVVEEEKVDLEIPQEKVDVKKADEAEPESAGGCDVCLPPNGLIGCGAYDYKYLCLPSMPWSRGGVAPPQFLGKDARLPLLLALVMGFQHALAMVAGIATSGGMLIAGDTCFPWQYDSAMCEAQNYLVSAAWITSGILTIIQVFRAKIHGTPYYLGTGLLSVMGTSFTFLPIAREMVVRSIADARSEGKCDGNDCRGFGKKGYGQFLGTAMAAAWFEVLIAFLPAKLRKKMFPTAPASAEVAPRLRAVPELRAPRRS